MTKKKETELERIKKEEYIQIQKLRKRADAAIQASAQSEEGT
jgi:hypothetical protein